MSFGSRGSKEEGEIPSFEDQEEVQADLPAEERGEADEGAQNTLVKFFAAKSEKGKDVLRRNGFEYVFDKDSKTEEGEFWRCPKKAPYCPGRAIIFGNWQEEETKRFRVGRIINEGHNHPQIDTSVRDAQQRLRESASTENPLSTRRAVDIARQQIPVGVRAENAPSSSAMSRSYRRYVEEVRKEAGDDQLDGQNITIPPRLENKVLFFDLMNQDTMIVFCSEFGQRILTQHGNEQICIDGTFKCRPLNFAQLYTINVMVDRTAIPAVYALMGDKQQNSYERLFREVACKIPNWQPQSVLSDFEIGAINACRMVFPQIQTAGCLFHFAQAIFKRIQTLPNLHMRFRNEEPTRMLLKSFIALAFVPLDSIYEYFCLLSLQFEQTDELKSFIYYFARNWLGCRRIMESPELPIDNEQYGPYGNVDRMIREWIRNNHFENSGATFSPQYWNVCDRVENDQARTNNALEGWHNVFNTHFKSGHPKLSYFVKQMEKEEEHWILAYEDFEASPANGIKGKGSKRRIEYIEQDRNLVEIFQTRQDRHPIDYLRAISYRLPNAV